MNLSEEMQQVISTGVNELKGYARRHFMAETVEQLYEGKAYRAEQELGWHRNLLRKALQEYRGQFCYVPQYHRSGRKAIEEHLPNLKEDMRELADAFSQPDPTFRTTQIYTRLTAKEMRKQLLAYKGYEEAELPSEETIRVKLNALGYGSKRVKKRNL